MLHKIMRFYLFMFFDDNKIIVVLHELQPVVFKIGSNNLKPKPAFFLLLPTVLIMSSMTNLNTTLF